MEIKNFADEVKKCSEATQNIGKVLDTVSSESGALRTTMSRHQSGLSLAHYRRSFEHLNGMEIPGSSKWLMVRFQVWSIDHKLFDIIDSSYDVVDPPQPIPGDVDG